MAVRVLPAAKQVVDIGGTPVVALFGPMLGGIIVNPVSAEDQGLAVPELLFVSIVGDADTMETTTTVPILPGQYWTVPPGMTNSVSINAVSSGHKFSAIVFQPPTPYPPTPQLGDFPPDGPTTLLETIPSYLYQQYNDDEDLQSFVSAYNSIAQEYVDWFNQIQLPVYTSDTITGDLLDWVADGLYGVKRPALASGTNANVGPLNTYACNEECLNDYRTIGPQNVVVTTDDLFKRILTWNFLKGDGRHANVRWLKRRILRFLLGVNGKNFNVDQTYQVSVTFSDDHQVDINLSGATRVVNGGAFPNLFAANEVTLNQLDTTFYSQPTFADANLLKEAIDAGVLELPFQYHYVVNV